MKIEAPLKPVMMLKKNEDSPNTVVLTIMKMLK